MGGPALETRTAVESQKALELAKTGLAGYDYMIEGGRVSLAKLIM